MTCFSLIYACTAQVVIEFDKAEYSGFESNNVTINVIKHGMNIGDFVVTVSPLSYSQFHNMGLSLPPDLPINMRPSDPAECKY